MQQHSFGSSVLILGILLIAGFVLTGCDGQPSGADLYALNCASCHGAAGKGGLAKALNDLTYLATHEDTVIARLIKDGVPNTTMRAFGKSTGGTLTDEQISAIVQYLR